MVRKLFLFFPERYYRSSMGVYAFYVHAYMLRVQSTHPVHVDA